MKKVKLLFLVLTTAGVLCACDNHEHNFKRSSCDQPLICTICGENGGDPIEHVYAEATCTEPAKCKACGAIKGEALGHDYSEATCTEAKKCKRCGTTDGEALGHDYAEATCTDAKKCKRCGETEGEPLGHSFLEATCTEPSTCERCGETQGEALGHDFMEANYQAPSTCSRCGETEGEPLLASFEEHGLKINGKYNVEMDYVTGCYENKKKTTTGKAKFTDLKIFKGDSKLPAKEGYVWIQIKTEIRFDDDAAHSYGWMVGDCNEDYYTIEAHDDSSVHYEEVPEEFKDFDGYGTYKVNYLGEEHDCESLVKADDNIGWIDTWGGQQYGHYGITWYFHVPDGYDGTVVGLWCRTRDNWPAGTYIYDIADENAIFYRVKPATKLWGD